MTTLKGKDKEKFVKEMLKEQKHPTKARIELLTNAQKTKWNPYEYRIKNHNVFIRGRRSLARELLNLINAQRDKGNAPICPGESIFIPALCLSDIIKKLEKEL